MRRVRLCISKDLSQIPNVLLENYLQRSLYLEIFHLLVRAIKLYRLLKMSSLIGLVTQERITNIRNEVKIKEKYLNCPLLYVTEPISITETWGGSFFILSSYTLTHR